MDNPLVQRGSAVYQPQQPINLTYDAFGPPAAFLRGLFEYQYQADRLTLVPHIPPTLTRLEQRFPVRFGAKQLHLATTGTGPITAVTLNGQPWTAFDPRSVHLAYDRLPEQTTIEIVLGQAKPRGFHPAAPARPAAPALPQSTDGLQADLALLLPAAQRLDRFQQLLADRGLAHTYEAAHARLALDCFATAQSRRLLLDQGKLSRLPNPASQSAADQLYIDTTRKLIDGLTRVLSTYEPSSDPHRARLSLLWKDTTIEPK